jgi:hypothetical protein
VPAIPDRTCATRTLKIARHLQKTRPDIVPATEPVSGFANILEGSDPSMRFVLRDALAPGKVPAAGTRAVAPLFQGSLTFVHLVVQSGAKSTALPPTDLATARSFAGSAVGPISQYAAQYGPNSLSVAEPTIELPVSVAKGVYNDSTLQEWLDGLVASSRLPLDTSALVVLNPPGPLNTDADPTRGVLGYHGKAKVPYAFVNVLALNLTVPDPADAFALALSHEIAEMTVDPSANLANPEVCDPCGPNCQTPIRAYFDAVGSFLGGTTAFPPPFAYGFFLNAIVQPVSASLCPAPPAACAYAPPRDVPPPAARRG